MNAYKTSSTQVDNAPLVDEGISLIREEAQARRAGFNNATMRRAQQTKPHIAKIGGYWRVSPWKPATRDLYYEAHAYVTRLNSLAKPIESNPSHDTSHTQQANQQPTQQPTQAQKEAQRAQLAKQLEHGLRYGISAGKLFQILEAQVACEQLATSTQHSEDKRLEEEK